MSQKSEPSQLMLPMPLGRRLVEELENSSIDEVRAMAEEEGGEKVFQAVHDVLTQDPSAGFLHSALCAMSLPVRCPKGEEEFAPIIRREGNYTLIIRPIERMKMVNGELVPTKLGVPYGSYARLAMLFIMTEAVRQKSREVYLGDSFAAWLRRMGITATNSGGPRGARALMQEQLDRLMACEWSIRWDQELTKSQPAKGKKAGKGPVKPVTISAFEASDMRLANRYGGVATEEGEFVSRFVLSEPFYETIRDHAVPLNERAFAALKRSATQLDLYTYLAYRLPKIREGEQVPISWKQLWSHLGNDCKTIGKFRQTVRSAWETVSGVYPQARASVDLSGQTVWLSHADQPVDNHPVKRMNGLIEYMSVLPDLPADNGKPKGAKGALVKPELSFPSGTLQYNCPELYAIAKEHGSGNDANRIADAFRRKLGDELSEVKGDRLVRRFTAFCKAFDPPG